MQTVPQHHAPANPPAPLVDIGTAQHAALMRWHSRDAIGEVMDALAVHPHYPCIVTARDATPSDHGTAPCPAA